MIVECVLAALAAVIGALVVSHVAWERSAFVAAIDAVPGPPKRPFVGNFPCFFRKHSDEILQILQHEFSTRYGGIYRLWLGRRPFIDISTPELIEKVTTSHELIDKSAEYAMLAPWLGNGLLLASGAKWHRSRRLLTPAFHFKILDEYFSEFDKNGAELCERLGRAIPQDRAEIDVLPLIRRCTLDMICETAMGIGTGSRPGYEDYIRAVERFANVLHERFMTITHFLPDFVYGFTKHGKEYHKLLEQLHSFTDQVIRERKRSLAAGTENVDEEETELGLKKRRPFMDVLLMAAKTNEDITDEYIRAEVDTFMFEGHDTTAAAITWLLYCLATNTRQQEMARDEVGRVLGDSERIGMEQLADMKYLECCIKESLRLYPPVPNFKRRVPVATELAGYTVPAGASISIHVYALHRRPELFDDPLAFRPERFSDRDAIAARHPFAFVPFSAGPRNCIGQRVAMLEMKVVAARLLRRFRFVYDSSRHGPAKACQDLVLKPKHGMPLLITPLLA